MKQQDGLAIVKLSIDSLTPYKRNVKKHPPEQVEQIKESIRLYGNNDPIAVWGKKNMIVEGHGRFLALKELGYTEVECVRLDHLTAQERREYTLVHNQTTMNSGFDLPTLKLELGELPAFDFGKFGFDFSLPGYPESSREDLTPYRPEPEPQEDKDEPPVTVSEDGFTDSFTLPDGDRRPIQEIHFTLSDDEAETVKEAIRIMKRSNAFKDYENPLNQNSNGNALFLVVSEWLAQRI